MAAQQEADEASMNIHHSVTTGTEADVCRCVVPPLRTVTTSVARLAAFFLLQSQSVRAASRRAVVGAGENVQLMGCHFCLFLLIFAVIVGFERYVDGVVGGPTPLADTQCQIDRTKGNGMTS